MSRGTLGAHIRKRREEEGLTISDLARRLQTSVKYIRAMEDGDYALFTAKVYARGFFQKAAELFFPDGVSDFLREFDTEWEVEMMRRKAEHRPVELRTRAFVITPVRIGIGAAVAAGVFLAVFFGSAVVGRLSAPGLVITSPLDGSVYNGPRVVVRGRAPAQSRIAVNARSIAALPDGHFEEAIELGVGLQRLEFVLNDKFDRVKKVVRYIYVK